MIFSDYECPDCKLLEREIIARVRADSRFSLSVKQFPLSTVCNPHLESDIHPDACWAARAAEVAGLLGGNATFWAMNDWLYEKGGSFDEPALRAALATLRLDPARAIAMLESPEIAARIKADIEEGIALGIQGAQTPMIFINGVELRGWTAPNALARAVDALLATNPPPRTASADRPPMAREKFIEDWAIGPKVDLPPEVSRHSMGSATPRVRVVVFGDYLEPTTAKADRTLRSLASAPGSQVQYSFQHFPFDQACNSGVPTTKHPHACAAARLVEAAGTLGGHDAFWRAHAWAFEDLARTKSLLERGLATGELAQHLGLDAGTFLDASVSPGVAGAIAEDCRRAREVGLTRLPWIYINGQLVREWSLDGDNFLSSLVEAARSR